eukprot:11429-Heterococcus_DN1.PRE.3
MLTTSMYYTLCADSVTVIESPTGDCEPLHRAIVKADTAAAATASTATVGSTAAAAMDEIEEQRPPTKLPTIGILINKEEALPPLTVLTRDDQLSLGDSPATGDAPPLLGEGRGVLALTERRTILTSLLSRATSLSCASLSGQQLLAVMLPLLQLLQDKPPREQPVLYVIKSELNVALELATQ